VASLRGRPLTTFLTPPNSSRGCASQNGLWPAAPCCARAAPARPSTASGSIMGRNRSWAGCGPAVRGHWSSRAAKNSATRPVAPGVAGVSGTPGRRPARRDWPGPRAPTCTRWTAGCRDLRAPGPGSMPKRSPRRSPDTPLVPRGRPAERIVRGLIHRRADAYADGRRWSVGAGCGPWRAAADREQQYWKACCCRHHAEPRRSSQAPSGECRR
jgi:hypothetical protein